MTDIASLALRVDALEVSAASRELKKFSDQAGATEKSAGSLGFATALLSNSFKLLAAGFASLKMSQFITESTQLNQRYQELGIVLAQVGKNAGISSKELNETAKAVKDTGISMIESRQIVTKLVQANIDLSNATKLARVAQDAAVIGQINSSEALQRMIHGITSAEVEVLRGIGINVSFEQSYAKLAKQMGVTTAALTENDKMQARMNAALEAGTNIAGVYEASLDNAGKQLRSTARLSEDLKVKVGGLFDQTMVAAVATYASALKDADKEMDRLTESGELQAWGDDIARVFAALSDAVRNSFKIITTLAGTAIDQMKNIKNFDVSGFVAANEKAGNALKEIMGDADRNTEALKVNIAIRDMSVKTLDRETISLGNNAEEVKRLAEEEAKAEKAKKAAEDAAKKHVTAQNAFVEGLQAQAREAGVTGIKLIELQAAYLGVAEAVKPYIAALKQEAQVQKDKKALETFRHDMAEQQIRDMERVKQIIQDTATAEEIFIQKQEELNRLLSQGKLDPGTYFKALEKAGDQMRESMKKGTEQFQQLTFAVQGWGRQAADALVEFATSGKASFSDFAESVIKDIMRMYIQMQIITPLMQSLPGSGFGTAPSSTGTSATSSAASASTFQNLFKGFRAAGGPVSKRSMYQINERGSPELLMSGGKQYLMTNSESGQVSPLQPAGGRSGGGGGNITVNIIEAPGKGGQTSQKQTAQGVELEVMVDQIVAKNQAKNGTLSNKGLKQNFGLNSSLIMR